MHIHILGICGTFMGGIARLAVEKGFKVTGSDKNCYPPMSDQLESMGIALHEGYDSAQLSPEPDCVVVGNAMSRGVEVVETLLNSNQSFRSGPQWLNENILHDKWVIAVAGTHGKTSTSSMVTWILEDCGYNPGFLIGGVLENFGVSARLTDSPFFVVEADEYDTAFFDKRSKFVHYRARTCILNNLEFDHADIFNNLAEIENQFHHLVRTIPGQGAVIYPFNEPALARVLNRGCWSPKQSFAVLNKEQNIADANKTEWAAKKIKSDGSCFKVFYQGKSYGELNWSLIGDHNVSNALAAIAAAHHVGVAISDAISAMASFKNVKRRMELKGEVNNISVFDDFAHHPTAIKTTLAGLRNKVADDKIIAIVDLRSNTMKQGVHKDTLVNACEQADQVIFHKPSDFTWDFDNLSDKAICLGNVESIIEQVLNQVKPNDKVLVMSNGGFGGIHDRLLEELRAKS